MGYGPFPRHHSHRIYVARARPEPHSGSGRARATSRYIQIGGSRLSKTLRALCLGVALVALMVACVGSILLGEIRRPAGADEQPIAFVVAPGDSTSTIATNLRREGLIRLPQLFTLLVRMQGFDGQLQAGNYLLRPN